MTNEQIDFILKVEKEFDSLHPGAGALEPIPGGGWHLPTDKVFAELFKAIAAGDEIEVARITAMMLLEICLCGNSIQHSAARWCTLFGPMFADA